MAVSKIVGAIHRSRAETNHRVETRVDKVKGNRPVASKGLHKTGADKTNNARASKEASNNGLRKTAINEADREVNRVSRILLRLIKNNEALYKRRINTTGVFYFCRTSYVNNSKSTHQTLRYAKSG